MRKRLLTGFFLICLFLNNFAIATTLQNFYQAALDAYIYAYPLVMVNVTKEVMTNVSQAENNGRAPINQFSHVEHLATPYNRDVIRPNCDTLYSNAWLDLSHEPMVLSVPDTKDRYYVLPILDAWTEVIDSIGIRTTGNKAKNYLLAGPNFPLINIPSDLDVIVLPTNYGWITGRTLVNQPDYYQDARNIQLQYKLIPYSAFRKKFDPPVDLPINTQIDMDTTPSDQVNQMNAEVFFTTFTQTLKLNPPHEYDAGVLEKLKTIKIIPGEDFNAKHYSKAELKALNRAVKRGLRKIKNTPIKNPQFVNGWFIAYKAGHYGDRYLARAGMALYGIGANIPEDSLYPTTFTDSEHRFLNGSNQYVIHFDHNQIPTVQGFWSITLYGQDGYLVENPLHRYALGDRSDLIYNEDGSLDIYIQHENPGSEKEKNWLPTPLGDFNLTMRLYWPEQNIIEGYWYPPQVKKVAQ